MSATGFMKKFSGQSHKVALLTIAGYVVAFGSYKLYSAYTPSAPKAIEEKNNEFENLVKMIEAEDKEKK